MTQMESMTPLAQVADSHISMGAGAEQRKQQEQDFPKWESPGPREMAAMSIENEEQFCQRNGLHATFFRKGTSVCCDLVKTDGTIVISAIGFDQARALINAVNMHNQKYKSNRQPETPMQAMQARQAMQPTPPPPPVLSPQMIPQQPQYMPPPPQPMQIPFQIQNPPPPSITDYGIYQPAQLNGNIFGRLNERIRAIVDQRIEEVLSQLL